MNGRPVEKPEKHKQRQAQAGSNFSTLALDACGQLCSCR